MKICAACHEDLPKDKFSKKQWKLEKRRCKVCISDNREVQPLPPSPPPNNNNGSVDSNASNDGVIDRLLESMSINDREMIAHLLWITPGPKTDKEVNKRELKRVEKDDAYAIHNQGGCYADGARGYLQDYSKALELWHRAGELGHAESYHNIACLYNLERDKKKARHYTELAAMGGGVSARHHLGIYEEKEGNAERATKHYIMSAGLGHGGSLDRIKGMFMRGHATKDDYTQALRAHQAYLNEIKSAQRDKAAELNSVEFKYY